MTLTDALAATLDGTWPTTDDPRGYGAPSWRYDFAAFLLADPALREALTAALAEAIHATPGVITSSRGYTPEDHLERCREVAPAIVAAMLP